MRWRRRWTCEGLKRVLADLDEGRIRSVAVDTPVPSAFSHEILNANPYAYLDDAPLEERRARAVEMRRVLPAAVATEFGRLDPAAIAQVRADAWPDVRDADELHDALCSLIAVPESGEAKSRGGIAGVGHIASLHTGLERIFRGIGGAAPGCARSRSASARTGCARKRRRPFGRFSGRRQSQACRRW